MVKKYKAALSALLAVLLVFAVITVTGVVDINKIVKENEQATTEGEAPKKTYENVFETYSDAGFPLMKTDIENVFYTMSKTGEVAFFKASNSKIEKIENVKTFDVSVSCSGQKLPAKIYYIEIEGKTLGYGLFTNEQHPEVYLYDYAFFKVTNQFAKYTSSDLLLLIDIDKNRFYDDEKVYSESFYLYESYSTKPFLNEDQRIVDLNARLRTDYKVFTDGILHQSESKILFFSSRFYNDYDYSDKVDIFISGGSGENVDNNRYILDVASLNFWRTDKGVYYLKNKEVAEENTTGAADGAEAAKEAFAVMVYDGKESKESISFEGSLDNDFILDEEYLLHITSGEVYNILTGETFKIDYSKFETSFTPDIFEISENGKYCVVRGRNNLNKPSVGLLNVATGEFTALTDNVFGQVASVQVANDSTVVISLAANEQATAYYQLVAKINVNEVSGSVG